MSENGNALQCINETVIVAREEREKRIRRALVDQPPRREHVASVERVASVAFEPGLRIVMPV